MEFYLVIILLCLDSCFPFVMHQGLHVCTTQKHTQRPVKSLQSFCSPMYRKHLYRCGGGLGVGGNICTTFRVSYRLSYREAYRMEMSAQVEYKCCPGWTKRNPADKGCTKPICVAPCVNGGMCIAPDKCACPNGWTGQYCEKDVDECTQSKCQHKCINTPGKFHCECNEGFELEDDKISCKLCLGCMPEVKTMSSNYENLTHRMQKLETEKKNLQANLTQLENQHKVSMDNLREEVLERCSQLTTPPGAVADDYRSGSSQHVQSLVEQRNTMAIVESLSKQIALLEERMEMCSCNYDHQP